MGMGSGMPYMPMAPMAGGNSQKEERERSTWLSEDAEVWGQQDDAAPAVVQGLDPTQIAQVVPVVPNTPRKPVPGPAHAPTREQAGPRYRTTGA
ncbi:MAG: hypothetical protein QG608_2505 [Actinomycetota bacterium]|nr:hypothetical protein [Actinomycetota bacterium]